MSSWDLFRACISNDIACLGVSRFREFPAVIQTMYGSDIFWDTTIKYLPKAVMSLIKEQAVAEKDIYSLGSQYYNQVMFNSLSRIDMSKVERIFEFGGGVGFMAHMFRMLGFTGQYTIYDFPETKQIQRYYLNSVGINDVILTSEFPLQEQDLFIACWSLSEASPRPALCYFPSKQYWVAFHKDFDGLNNIQYFTDELQNIHMCSAPHHNDSYFMTGNLR